MPYVDEHWRKVLDEGGTPQSVGQLTYAVLVPVRKHLEYLSGFGEVRYADLAGVIAALDNAKEEFRRRVLNPYEDVKIEEEGDINWGLE